MKRYLRKLSDFFFHRSIAKIIFIYRIYFFFPHFVTYLSISNHFRLSLSSLKKEIYTHLIFFDWTRSSNFILRKKKGGEKEIIEIYLETSFLKRRSSLDSERERKWSLNRSVESLFNKLHSFLSLVFFFFSFFRESDFLEPARGSDENNDNSAL